MTVTKLPQRATIQDRQVADALAYVQRMTDDLIDARDDIAKLRGENDQLRVELNREQDRVTLALEDRDRYRAEALTFRDMLIKLSTQMASIGELTVAAQDVVRTVYGLTTNQPSPPNEAPANPDV